MARIDVRFPSWDGSECAAWLYLPEGEGPVPVVVMAHGLGGVRQMGLDDYAERFHAEGYACLVFEYRNFGDSEGEPRQLLEIRRQQEDWAAAIVYARSLPELDKLRVILWATGLSGGHVITQASLDRDVAAVVSAAPFTHGVDTVRGAGLSAVVRMGLRGMFDAVGAWFGLWRHNVALYGPPGSTAVVAGPGMAERVRELVPERLEVREDTPARSALQFLTYHPGRDTVRVSCPILFCVCENDEVAPARSALRYAGSAPHGEVRTYPEGHFGLFRGDGFEQAVADQIEFLKRHVPVAK